MTDEEELAALEKLRPIDDVLFEHLARNKEVMQEILRVILGKNNLIVRSVITQASERNMFNRSTILDVLCTLDDGVHDIYVNTAIDDGSIVAALMKCFLQTEVDDNRFPELSAEMKRLKNTEKGRNNMCKVIDDLIEKEMRDKNTLLYKKNEQLKAKNRKLKAKDAQIANMKAKNEAELKAKDQYIAELERRLGLA